MAARFPVKKKRTRGELHIRERERRKGKEQGRKGAGHDLIRWWRLRSLAAAMGSWLGHWLAIGSGEKETGSRGSGWCGGESEEGIFGSGLNPRRKRQEEWRRLGVDGTSALSFRV